MAYRYRAKLILKVPLEGDSGVVRIDKKTMEYLGLKKGEKVEITASFWSVRGTYVLATVDELPSEDEGQGIIRLSKDKLEDGNFRPGDKVIVSKA
ncbi:MAG: hypothetical protein L6N95_00370 [Candidatus Methylarchaceae archaeon HK01B]|nr:hypothetical protein [Candidatus Methylarchaceae archaeon HK01B]